VATTSILGDIVRHIVGDDADVEVLIGVGVDPHEFAPSSQQAATIVSADLVVANGLGLEGDLTDVLVEAAEGGAPMLFVGEVVDPVQFGDATAPACATSEEGFDDGCDPHFWMDPARAGTAAIEIAAALADAGLEGPWDERAQEYRTALLEVDTRILDMFEKVASENRKLVTNHDALGYLARRYGFEVVGVIIPGGSTLGEPSSADLARLVGTIEAQGVRAIFVDGPESTALADSLASELDHPVAVVVLFGDSLGGEGSGASTLSEMLLTTAARITEALR
jgi:zinc/manganese transport system substrate-binding protein